MKRHKVICDLCRRELGPDDKHGQASLLVDVVLLAPPFDLCEPCTHQLKRKLENGEGL